jgi:hypothetical protein
LIRVILADEPKGFDKAVRQPGLAAIDELVGRAPRTKRRGPRRAKLANTEAGIPADKFPPFWRDAIDDMMRRTSSAAPTWPCSSKRRAGPRSIT